MKKLLKIISPVLLLFALIVIFLYLQINTYSKIININWSIKLPNSYKEIYSKDSGASFHGDGQRYHIFKYNSEKEINQALKWINTKNVSIEVEINEILNNLNVSKQNMPDYDKKYKYYVKFQEDTSKIYLIFVPDTKKLYIIENII